MEGTANPRVFLVVVDESKELQAALHYAARLRIPITIVPGGLTREHLDAVS